MVGAGATRPSAPPPARMRRPRTGGAGSPAHDSLLGGECRLERHSDHPGNKKGPDAAGEPGREGHQPCEIRSRNPMRGTESAGQRQEHGYRDRRQEPQKAHGTKQRRLAGEHQIEREHAEGKETRDQMRGDEGLVARRRDRVVANQFVDQRPEIGAKPAQTLTSDSAHFSGRHLPPSSPLSLRTIIGCPA